MTMASTASSVFFMDTLCRVGRTVSRVDHTMTTPPLPPLTLDDLDFELPPELIAQQPPEDRGAAQLMIVQAGADVPSSIERFDDAFVAALRPGDLVVANDSRVLHARIPIVRTTGGAGELLLLAPLDAQPDPAMSRWSAMARPARKLQAGTSVTTKHVDAAGKHGRIALIDRSGAQTWDIELPVALDEVPAWLQQHGELPLPPYVTERGQEDGRYQTVHARHDGSVAAPTAGLHFTDATWERVRQVAQVAHVTLHVGAGTFLPVNVDDLDEHVMHHERYEVPDATDTAVRAALADGRRIIAVGTTSCRVLESVYGPRSAPRRGSTDLFIRPGYEWGCVSGLLTNFHLPQSTLIALVMAFQGVEETRALYRHAIQRALRFFSFGDAMFLEGPPQRSSLT
jgi:S-adenosylmethionine:tRNA ribosyltransferase-isomerase